MSTGSGGLTLFYAAEMSDLEDLRERLAALEATVRQQADLRAAVDRDQADMGSRVAATHHLVQALAITQSDHGDKLARLDERLSRIEAGIALLNRGQQDILVLLTRLVDES